MYQRLSIFYLKTYHIFQRGKLNREANHSGILFRSHTHTHTQTHTHTRTHARTHTRTHARARAPTHARTRASARTHTHTQNMILNEVIPEQLTDLPIKNLCNMLTLV